MSCMRSVVLYAFKKRVYRIFIQHYHTLATSESARQLHKTKEEITGVSQFVMHFISVYYWIIF